MVQFEISKEAVGFIVYALNDGKRLTLMEVANSMGLEILEVSKIMAQEGGFNAEPPDGLAFFLFEDRASAFVQAMNARQ